MSVSTDILDFYRKQSDISSPGKYAYLLDALPTDIHELSRIIPGFLIHQFWILRESNYGVGVDTFKAAGRNLNAEINLRSVEEMLAAVLKLDSSPLTSVREPKQRLVGNCRDYSLLMVSMLRHQGIPARVRSGVGRYFYKNEVRLEDHFICEWWNESEQRWQRTDPQIDDLQRKVLGMEFDPVDLPPGQFLDSVESYFELKEGRVAADKIGIFDFSGWKYVRYKLISDLAGVNGVEVLAWESWGVCNRFVGDAISEEDQALVDQVIECLSNLDRDSEHFKRARDLWDTHPQLQFPPNYNPQYWELPPFK